MVRTQQKYRPLIHPLGWERYMQDGYAGGTTPGEFRYGKAALQSWARGARTPNKRKQCTGGCQPVHISQGQRLASPHTRKALLVWPLLKRAPPAEILLPGHNFIAQQFSVRRRARRKAAILISVWGFRSRPSFPVSWCVYT